MRPYLVVDSNIDDRDWLEVYRAEFPSLEAARAIEGVPRDPTPYAGILMTGSAASVVDPAPWLAGVEALVGAALDADVPVLGICFGHQVLGRVVGGAEAVFTRERPEVGWLPVRQAAPDPILAGFTDPFTAFVTHGDEVRPVDGLRILAYTEACPVQALRVVGRRAWGVQFHVETTAEQEAGIVSRRAASDPGLDAEALLARRVDATPMRRTLFANFRRLVAQ